MASVAPAADGDEPRSAFAAVASGESGSAASAPAVVPTRQAGVALHRPFVVELADGSVLRAQQLVLATGAFSVPRVPARLAAALAERGTPTLHVADYRSYEASVAPLLERVRENASDSMPMLGSRQPRPLVVVVVGAGASGTQIATGAMHVFPSPSVTHAPSLSTSESKDICISHAAESGALRPITVYLVGRDVGTLPRRVMGKDVYWWLEKTGALTMDKDSAVGKRARAANAGRGDPLVG